MYRNPWMIVREDDVRRADGSRGIYGVIDKPTTHSIVARDGDRFRPRRTVPLSAWLAALGIPAGHGAGTPTLDPAELAARELREETGLRAESMVRSASSTLRRG